MKTSSYSLRNCISAMAVTLFAAAAMAQDAGFAEEFKDYGVPLNK